MKGELIYMPGVGIVNRQSQLLDLIEHRLGTKQLNLPDTLNKDVWFDNVISKETLNTFSRFFPYEMTYYLTADRRKGPYYLIDENVCPSVNIIGIGDIDWHILSKNMPAFGFGSGFYSTFDFFLNGLDVEGIAMQQQMVDHASIFKAGIYVEFKPPNMVRLQSNLSNNMLEMLKAIPIHLFVVHAPNLMTIEPTKMETFEQLAVSDVAIYLYNNLKYYNNINTPYATAELQIDILQDYANRRDDIVQQLRDGYVNFGNRNMPMLLTI
jgi:hypothetical protein